MLKGPIAAETIQVEVWQHSFDMIVNGQKAWLDALVQDDGKREDTTDT